MNTQHPYTVRNIKSFEGREGVGFNADLYRDGRKVAFVIDHANGGVFSYRWLANDAATRNADERALEDYVHTLPAWSPAAAGIESAPNETYPMDADLFLSELVEAAENEQRVRRWLRKQMSKRLLFVLDGQIKSSMAPPSASLQEVLAQRHPGAVFLNPLPFDSALALYRQHANH